MFCFTFGTWILHDPIKSIKARKREELWGILYWLITCRCLGSKRSKQQAAQVNMFMVWKIKLSACSVNMRFLSCLFFMLSVFFFFILFLFFPLYAASNFDFNTLFSADLGFAICLEPPCTWNPRMTGTSVAKKFHLKFGPVVQSSSSFTII